MHPLGGRAYRHPSGPSVGVETEGRPGGSRPSGYPGGTAGGGGLLSSSYSNKLHTNVHVFTLGPGVQDDSSRG